jgi:S1-C subfamily serine protease
MRFVDTTRTKDVLPIIVAFLLLSNPAWVFSQPSNQQSWNAIRDANADSVVFITVTATLANGLEEKRTGTGFLLNSGGFVITDNHVVPANEQYKDLKLVGAVHSRYAFPYPLTVVQREPNLDLVLLKFPETGVKWRGVTICDDSNKIPVASRFLVLGFP